jgi:hypothetical protein
VANRARRLTLLRWASIAVTVQVLRARITNGGMPLAW